MYLLSRLYSRFEQEVDSAVQIFLAPIPTNYPFDLSCKPVHAYCAEMCTIRLQDAWARFCRELIIESAGCEPITYKGARVPKAVGIVDRKHVLPHLRSLQSMQVSNNWEPNWAIPVDTIRAAQTLKVNNFADISSGIGLTPCPLDDLRSVRNFFAHRNRDTARKVHQTIGSRRLQRKLTAIDVLKQIEFPGIQVFVRWADEIKIMALLSIH